MLLVQMREQTASVTGKDPERRVLCPSDCFSHACWCCPRVRPGPLWILTLRSYATLVSPVLPGQGSGVIDLTFSNINCLTMRRNVFGLEHNIRKFHQLGNLSRVIYVVYVFVMLFEVCIAYIV